MLQNHSTKRKREEEAHVVTSSTTTTDGDNATNDDVKSTVNTGEEEDSKEQHHIPNNNNHSVDDSTSTTEQIEPSMKKSKIETEYDVKIAIFNEDVFPCNGSKLYTDDSSSDDDDSDNDDNNDSSIGGNIEDIWHVKNVRKIMLDVLAVTDLNIWNESENKKLFDELIERREEIETISLFLAESMIKKVTIHDTKFITDMIENMSKTIPDYSKTLEMELVEGFTPSSSNTLKNWLKYILPEIVKKQNALNLIDESNSTINDQQDSIKLSPEEEKEKEEILNAMQYDPEEENDYAFLLDPSNLALPGEIECQINEEQEICEDMEETSDDYFIDHFFNEYLFDSILLDEKEDITLTARPFKGILTENAATLQEDNPFLSILEKTMQMFTNGETKEEHQDLQVSPMRLGLSLLILDCLNRELSYTFNRGSTYHTISRPLVRCILDHFIDMDVHKIYFKLPPRLVEYEGKFFSDINPKTAKDEIRQLRNAFDIQKPNFKAKDFGENELDYSDEDSELSEDNIDEEDEEFLDSDMCLEYGEDAIEDFKKLKYENYKYTYCGGDTNLRLAHSEHPLWHSFPLTQKNLVRLNYHQLNSYNPVPLSIDSSSHWLYSEEAVNGGEEETKHIPFHEQSIVTLFPENVEEGDVMVYAEHLFHFNSDVKHQPPTQESIHIDLNRLFRRSGNLSFSSGALVEGFLSLKSFISNVIQTLMVIKKDDVVSKLDVVDALDFLKTPLYPGLQIVQPSGDNYVPLPTPVFDTELTTISPALLEDVVFENPLLFFTRTPQGEEPLDDEPLSLRGDYDTVINNSTFADHITLFLQDSNPYNDSFIELNGHKVEIYTPIIKHRCKSMYDEHFSTPEKRSQGFSLTLQDDFTFDMVYYWVEMYYLGCYISMNDKLEDDQKFYALLSRFPITVSSATGIDNSTSEDIDVLPEDKEWELDELDTSNSCFTLNTLYHDEETKDFELVFINHPTMEKKTRRVHKYILACRSSFFRQILEGNYTDRVLTDSFDIGDIFKDEQTIDAFLYYLYHNFVVMPPIKIHEFVPIPMAQVTLHCILGESDDSPKTELNSTTTTENSENENEINLYLSLFISSDYLMVEGLKMLCENVIGGLVNEENAIQLLEFSNEHSSETIFEFVDNFFLSSSLILEVLHIINQDISLYYEILSGPITFDNIYERIKRALELADKENCQLYRFHSERLESFHIPQLVAFILRNYDHFASQESFKQPFREIKYSETLSVWDHVSIKYNRMNSVF